MLTHRNILRIIIGFALIEPGLHIVMVATGYIAGGTAPIIDRCAQQEPRRRRAPSIRFRPRWW